MLHHVHIVPLYLGVTFSFFHPIFMSENSYSSFKSLLLVISWQKPPLGHHHRHPGEKVLGLCTTGESQFFVHFLIITFNKIHLFPWLDYEFFQGRIHSCSFFSCLSLVSAWCLKQNRPLENALPLTMLPWGGFEIQDMKLL